MYSATFVYADFRRSGDSASLYFHSGIRVNDKALIFGMYDPCDKPFLCRLWSIVAHRDHFVRRLSVHLSVCLSGSHTFLVVTHSYVSQATHAFLGMLPLFQLIFCKFKTYNVWLSIWTFWRHSIVTSELHKRQLFDGPFDCDVIMESLPTGQCRALGNISIGTMRVTLTFDLFQGQIFCCIGDHNTPNLLFSQHFVGINM